MMAQPVWSIHSNTARHPVRLDEVRFMFQSDQEVTIPPGGIRSVSTGIGFTLPGNVGALLYPVSGLYSLHFPRFLKSTNNAPLVIKIINLSTESAITIEAGQDLLKMLCQRPVSVHNFPFTRGNESAFEPVRHADSIGWILKSPVACTIEPNTSEVIDTGISTPGVAGYDAYVYPLHEFCTSNYIVTNNDSLCVRIMNCSQTPVRIEVGDELGLVTLNEAVHAMVLQVNMEHFQRVPLSPINRRG